MQRINRTGVNLPLVGAVTDDRQRRVRCEEPPDDLGFVVPPVVQYGQQAGQTLDHPSGVVEERLRHHDRSRAANRQQVSLS